MSGSHDISFVGLVLALALLAIPITASIALKLGVVGESLISVVRMVVQLGLVGLLLEYVFRLNHPAVNLLWLFVMIVVATQSLGSGSGLSTRIIFLPSFVAIGAMTLFTLFYFNLLIIGLGNPFDAKYLIAVGGMILGNAMRGIIVGIGDFYRHLRRDEERYLAALAAGASRFEAVHGIFESSVRAAVNPTIATMATTGIVSLPGMMTGQILGGTSPMLAIKYQIAIMIAIFVALVASVIIGIVATLGTAFDDYGILDRRIFKK